MRYRSFDPRSMAEHAHHYLTHMVDPERNHLPYWLILPNLKPAEAAHCRVDDAELVGSWYEGLDSCMHVLQTREGMDVLHSFEDFLRSSWGPQGLRYHARYPWTHTMHSSFHEMGYILPALNRMLRKYPDDADLQAKTSGLVRGMRGLVVQREVKTFWSGDTPEDRPIYEFPNDVYLLEGGFDLTRYTGRGEQPIRHSVLIPALTERYMDTGDPVALDLALGLANHLLGPSRYLNWQYAFFGHVHSATWTACGLCDLTEITGNDEYLRAARGIYDYVRSISSSFGWVPEYAQWHPMQEEHCETCCIKDMLVLADRLIRKGYDQYWEDMLLFSRNHLVENQMNYTGYVQVDNDRPDAEGKTWKHLDDRMAGGFTGGSLPNSIALSKFRSIAGCCAGTAPMAIALIWDRAVTEEGSLLTVNFPFCRKTADWEMESWIPDEGRICLTPFRDRPVAFRYYPYMGQNFTCLVNRQPHPFRLEKGLILTDPVPALSRVELLFPMETVQRREEAAGRVYTVSWRGPDVIAMDPPGEHLRLYQRDLSLPPVLPGPEDVTFGGAANYGPTQQSRPKN